MPLESSATSTIEETTVAYWNDFYKNFDSEKIKIKLVYSDCTGRKQIKNSKIINIDEDEIIRSTFFPRDKTCSGVAILNKKGDFKIKSGKYTQENVSELISQLEN
ncbi:hypothetical protein [Flavobacterium sp. Arc2]|jgi:predicted transcriptional regulator|uniref:hypothetical protein n=1 Tax=Flavobacterium sp. Arc2 TaxID=3046685 RepID=UPI00352F9D97